MTADHVLIWMSAKKEGSWSQFKQAVETLYIPALEDSSETVSDPSWAGAVGPVILHNALRLNITRLGHAEFYDENGRFRWRIVPPTIATTNVSDGVLGILCGARTPALLEILANECNSSELQILEMAEGPSAVTVSTQSEERLAEIADKCRVNLQCSSAEALLLTHPNISCGCFDSQSRLPAGTGWGAKQFSPSTLSWQESSPTEVADAHCGLFQIRAGYPWKYLMPGDEAYVEVSKEVGIYRILSRSRRRILRFSEKSMTLTVPAACRPPILTERALVLRSGLLPTFSRQNAGRSFVTYGNIPLECASTVSSILCQRLSCRTH